MSQKSEKFFDAVTHIREDLIEEAQNHKFRKRTAAWKKSASLAACIVLILSVSLVAVLPRGCGSKGGGADSNSPAAPSAGDAAAPQESPASSETAPPPPGAADGSHDPDEAPADGTELHQFTAVVAEVREDAILVDVTGQDPDCRYLVPTGGLEVPALAEGDWVCITCAGGPVLTANPPMILDVRSIEKTDPAE